MSTSESSDVHLSKTLCWLLRHGAEKEGLDISADGYIKVSDLLKHHKLKGKYSIDDIKRIVETNNKQRFSLRCGEHNELEICANQQHSQQRRGNVDAQLSKTLSRLLRHDAVKEGLRISADGYIGVSDLLKHPSLKGNFSLDDIKRIVETNDKQRFSLRCGEHKELEICVNQQHSQQRRGNVDAQLSKTLSRLLRHDAVKEGLRISADGYIGVSDLLKHPSLKGNFSVDDIKRIVETNDKQRFSLRCGEHKELEICANQRHSQQRRGNVDAQLSKTLSRLLRHDAVKEGLRLSADGYIRVSDLLKHPSLKGNFSLDDIKRIVETNDKQRFSLRCGEHKELEICANQRHSQQRQGDVDVQLSKTLSWLLRYSAVKEGLTISADRYIKVSDLLQHRKLKGNYTIDDIKRIVETDTRQRFSLRCGEHKELEIRAYQRYSLQRSGDVDVQLSKILSWLLRHSAVKEGLRISADGYIKVSDILKHRKLKGKYNIDDIKRIVETNNKQRFSLRCGEHSELEICANQGHSLQCVTETALKPLTDTDVNIIHGTYYKQWEIIKSQGLSRMSRNHIHFATGLPNDATVISGIRASAEVFIYIDLKQALSDGIEFFKSVNNVILSPGDDNGIIKPKYFHKVVDKHNRKLF
ncbi:unnamed protein product [Acanthoscelides obtectus]|uniref:2'-phosphotransferase n=1 Tax=Acanthoscelides obtectus TaxID=200917 RepID=A0A9P0K3I6_ACAOB|nr:unnamed protein product [Acanthoscelides obtectus]CAK1665882.1 tRNA 2'-phosphotransferase 1 [Acanthoscelides obtectus]